MLPNLTTPRLVLRPAISADVDALWSLWTDQDVRRFLWDDRIITREHAATFLTGCQAHVDRGLGLWVVSMNDGDSTIGCAGLLPVGAAQQFAPDLAGSIEPIVALTPARWQSGLATEALRVVIAHGFATLRLPQLVAIVDQPNIASHRLMARLGGKPERRIPGPRDRLWIYRLTPPAFAYADAE
jgi:[ribosomal protein S5]-alanine N-acetyltransferase